MRLLIIAFFLLIGANGFCQLKVCPKVSVDVDTLSSSWVIHAHDSTFGLKDGINIVQLLDGCDCSKSYVFFNCHIDQDTGNTNQIFFSPPGTDASFTVSVYNPADSAYSPIFIEDSLGYYALVELHYYPKVNKAPEMKNEPISFTILPNPASGNSLTISLPELNENARIIIYDILGREVSREKIPVGILQTKISIANLENGIYHGCLVSDHSRTTQKFEIVH